MNLLRHSAYRANDDGKRLIAAVFSTSGGGGATASTRTSWVTRLITATGSWRIP